jgi:fructokinase
MALLGVDFGGTKIEVAALSSDGAVLARRRAANPRSYDAALRAVRDLTDAVSAEAGAAGAPVGVGIPGSLNPATGLVRNANSVWLNGRAFGRDLEAALGRRVGLANDANCFTLSEATDGAAAGMDPVFGVILGTGCGGGVVVRGALVHGANLIAGEWGHTPLPWLNEDEHPGPECWCGRRGCLETWLSGPGMAADHAHITGENFTSEQVAAQAEAGDVSAAATLDRYKDRLARALAVVADIVDPACIVLGGGVSNIRALYAGLGERIAKHAFSDAYQARVTPALHGDSSGVRGAAWLWRDAVPGP